MMVAGKGIVKNYLEDVIPKGYFDLRVWRGKLQGIKNNELPL